MEKLIAVQSEYNSLDNLSEALKKDSSFEVSRVYDTWEMRTDKSGQMEQCVLVKKSSMHALKFYFAKEGTIKVNHVIPSKTMNAFFGRSVKLHRNVIEIVTGGIKNAIVGAGQKKAFKEMVQIFDKVKA